MRVRPRFPSLQASWAPSPARRLLRTRTFWAAGVVALGVLASMTLNARIADLESQRARWGEQQQVAVVITDLEVGDPVAPAIELHLLPTAMVPADAVAAVPRHSLAKTPLYRGEILLRSRMTHEQRGQAPDTAALTLPVTTQVPLLVVGDLVDLWVIDSANLSSHRVATAVTVLAFSERAITVAVPHAEVGEVAVASLRTVTVSLVG